MLVFLSYTIIYAAAGFADCNGNGIDDSQEIADGLVSDCQMNGIPDECERGGIEPIGYWRFESDTNNDVVDAGPLQIDGMANLSTVSSDVGPAEIPQTNLENTVSRALPGGAYVSIPDQGGALTMYGASFTFEAWVRIDNLSDDSSASERQTLAQKKRLSDAGDHIDYLLLVQAGDASRNSPSNYGKNDNFTGRELVVIFGTGFSTRSITSFLQIDDNDWHHVSFTHDADSSSIRFTVDDRVDERLFDAVDHVDNDGPLLIGAHTNASGNYNHFLRGAVDEVRLTEGLVPRELLLGSFAGGDCDGDEIPDGCEIAAGLESDCDGNGQPDDCQLIENDCNLNGIPDQCDPDCNENGIPDDCDIAMGTSDDCQPDGIPDECQIDGTGTSRFDLYGEGYLGFRSDVPEMVWLQRFNAENDGTVVNAIVADFGVAPVGTPMTACLWSDPNGDGEPADATLLWSTNLPFPSDQGLVEIPVPNVPVGSNQASYFVGFSMTVNAAADSPDFPASFDIYGDPLRGRSWLIGSNVPIDLNNLRFGTEEYALVSDNYMAGNWVIRTTTSHPALDCNGNGVPDDCDVAEGTSPDLDQDGRPDECGDCNENGILDGFEIADGSARDCDADGVPDECELDSADCDDNGVPDACEMAYGGDCNGNGVLDSCDIASGYAPDDDGSGVPDECEDCNGNGSIDAYEIDFGLVEDCNLNGVPDECEFGPGSTESTYLHDDGSLESWLNIVGAVEVAWMNHFEVRSGAEWVTAIEVVWASTFPGLPSKVVIWTDPDGDANPDDARVLRAFDTDPTFVLTGEYVTIEIPPTYVGEAGTSIFIGAYQRTDFGSAPIGLDGENPDGASWWAATTEYQMDIDDLAGSAYMTSWAGHDFMLRAVASSRDLANDCNENGVLDACDVIDGGSKDANGDGVPDECGGECLGDLNFDGLVDGADLIVLLGAWGEPGPLGDLNDDGLVDGADLLELLSAWGPCS